VTATILAWSVLPASVLARDNEVWFSPNDASPDYLELFTQPERWSQARAQVDVFKFGPKQLMPQAKVKRNSYQDLQSVEAFKKLHDWGIKLASEEPAIKEWDCTGRKTPRVTMDHLQAAKMAGGNIDIIALDEPLSSGQRRCNLSLEESARRTAEYFRSVKSFAGDLTIGDIEAYPAFSEADLERWVEAIVAAGFTPAFLHLDINQHLVDARPGVRMSADLQELRKFLRHKNIPLGVIAWSGYDPLNSDKLYYDHAMKLVRDVNSAIGRPDQFIFQSWITRSAESCAESNKECLSWPCSPTDPPYCGEKSIPINLPDRDPQSYSHTRLIHDALEVARPQPVPQPPSTVQIQ
jgi:hypothetical protein